MTKRKIPRQRPSPPRWTCGGNKRRPQRCRMRIASLSARLPTRLFPRIVSRNRRLVSTKENRITITWNRMLHHYELTRQALKLVALNDDGTLTLSPTESHTLHLRRVWVRSAYINLSPERRQAIKDSNRRRAEAGIKSPRNTRLLAARQAGVALKKLRTVAHATAP